MPVPISQVRIARERIELPRQPSPASRICAETGRSSTSASRFEMATTTSPLITVMSTALGTSSVSIRPYRPPSMAAAPNHSSSSSSTSRRRVRSSRFTSRGVGICSSIDHFSARSIITVPTVTPTTSATPA